VKLARQSCGDGAGITRGLAQAGAAGVWIARGMMEQKGLE